ncbi:MAG TPA: ferritin-like domain-containing protein [Myxococcaceae bacterium]|jgi:hypothetical protein
MDEGKSETHPGARPPAPLYLANTPAQERWGIQSWLERTAWQALEGTSFGVPADVAPPNAVLHEDPLLRKVYLIDVALFIGAEKTSYLATSAMMRSAPDELTQMQLGTQVLDECRHYEVFCKRVADLGVTPEKRSALVAQYTTPALRRFYDLILEQADRNDFYAASIAQNLIMEGMAYPIYRYEIRYWSRFDPGLSQIIRGAFADESSHVRFGEVANEINLQRVGVEERNRLNKLLGDFHLLMTDVFEEVIGRYVGLYQECANQYKALVGDIEIFPGRALGTLTEEDQIRTLKAEIQQGHHSRIQRLGLS